MLLYGDTLQGLTEAMIQAHSLSHIFSPEVVTIWKGEKVLQRYQNGKVLVNVPTPRSAPDE